MKKVFSSIIIIFLLTLIVAPVFFLAPTETEALEFAGSIRENYIPISSQPSITGDGVAGLENVNPSDPEAYFQTLFKIFVAVASILAVIRLMICGIKYMTSESITTKEAAKECIKYVIGGLLLMLTSVLILQTINKDFGELNFSVITTTIKDKTRLPDVESGPIFAGFESAPGYSAGEVSGQWCTAVRYQCPSNELLVRCAERPPQCYGLFREELHVSPNERYEIIDDCTENSDGDFFYSFKNLCSGEITTSEPYPPSSGLFEWQRNNNCENAFNRYKDLGETPLYIEEESCQQMP